MSAARFLPSTGPLLCLITRVIAGVQNVGVVPTPPCTTDVSAASSVIVTYSLQPFCSTLLGYTTPAETVTTTSTLTDAFTIPRMTTAITTVSVPFTRTSTTYTTNPVETFARRDESGAGVTPSALGSFASSVLTSACSLVATPSTATVTITTSSLFITFSGTSTITATSSVAVATTTATTGLDCGLVARENAVDGFLQVSSGPGLDVGQANCDLRLGYLIAYEQNFESFSIGPHTDGVVYCQWYQRLSARDAATRGNNSTNLVEYYDKLCESFVE